jgi:hypothetical protein
VARCHDEVHFGAWSPTFRRATFAVSQDHFGIERQIHDLSFFVLLTLGDDRQQARRLGFPRRDERCDPTVGRGNLPMRLC